MAPQAYKYEYVTHKYCHQRSLNIDKDQSVNEDIYTFQNHYFCDSNYTSYLTYAYSFMKTGKYYVGILNTLTNVETGFCMI